MLIDWQLRYSGRVLSRSEGGPCFDCYVLADYAADGWSHQERRWRQIRAGWPGLTDPRWFGIGAGVVLRKSDTDLKAMFNQAIKDIRANGKYKVVNDKHFDFDAYGDH